MEKKPAKSSLGFSGDTDGSVLIVGASGLIGSYLCSAYASKGRLFVRSSKAISRGDDENVLFDLANQTQVKTFSSRKLRSAIICAAITSIENCEADPIGTREINVTNTVALAKHLVSEGVFVIYPSSNLVFDGETEFTKEYERKSPRTEYGRQKVEVERQLLALGRGVSIVRFSKIIPPTMPLFLGWVVELLSGRQINPFSDLSVSPISMGFAVELLIRVEMTRLSGVVQASASSQLTYEQVALYLAKKIDADPKLVVPVSAQKMGVAVFNKYATLDSSRLARLGLEAPPPSNAIDELLVGVSSTAAIAAASGTSKKLTL